MMHAHSYNLTWPKCKNITQRISFINANYVNRSKLVFIPICGEN